MAASVSAPGSPHGDNVSNPPHFSDPSQNPSSPFYIHPSENLSSVLVSPVLSGGNYHSWSRFFRLALTFKNKMGFLIGSIPLPSLNDPTYPPWEHCNMPLISWLIHSVSPSIAQSIIYLDYVVAVWNDLRERFSQSDLLRIAELQEEIYALQQGSLTVTDFFTSLKASWEELDNFRPLPPCACQARVYHQQDFIIRFLKGLDDRLSVVCSQILLMDPLPSVNRVFSMVIQNERQHATVVSPLDAPNDFVNNVVCSSANATDARSFHGTPRNNGDGGPSRGGGGGQTLQAKSSKVCVYCKRTGHTVDVCYSKHGYPPGHPRYPGRPRFYSPNSGSSSSGSSSVNNTVIDDRPSVSHHLLEQQHGSGLQFTQAQYQHLMSLIQQATVGVNSDEPHSSTRANLIQKSPTTFSGLNGNMSFTFCSVTPQTSHFLSSNSLYHSSS